MTNKQLILQNSETQTLYKKNLILIDDAIQNLSFCILPCQYSVCVQQMKYS